MRYQGSPGFQAGGDRIGVLLVNTGTPDSLDIRDVRRYLAAFLGDPRVIEAPRLAWWIALHGWILRTRPRASAAKYRRIWMPEGSPLLVLSRRLRSALAQALGQREPTAFAAPVVVPMVEIAMLYSQPQVGEALRRLAQSGCRRILVLPLYPQYSGASTGPVHDQVMRELARWRRLPELRMVTDYHDDPGYIAALRSGIQAHWQQHGRPGHLLLSFHGIPQSYADRGDPYLQQCQRTAQLLTDALGLAQDAWTLSFQSRVGPTQWLQPYTFETVMQLPARGIRDLGVVCPGFAIDCLETLEEIGIENRQAFLQSGGEHFSYVPALNAGAEHARFLADLITRHCAGWT